MRRRPTTKGVDHEIAGREEATTASRRPPWRPSSLDAVHRGRSCYRRRAWAEAFRWFSRADQGGALSAEDLERWAVSAYLIGRDDDFLRALERAHRTYVGQQSGAKAARCAFWIGLRHLLRGERSRAAGWLRRGQRLVADAPGPCVEQGYLLVPAVEQHLCAGQAQAAYTAATRAARIGKRFQDQDLLACARHLQGRARIQQGRVEEGLALLDEAMVAVLSGELSPVMTGLLYCSMIDSCQQLSSLGRAREWTAALAAWCAEQRQMVAFTGTCLAHRAEILQLYGDWKEAVSEAQRACARFAEGIDRRPPAVAMYQLAEVCRLRGELRAAEEAYGQAARWGQDPQPGLALLRLTQGRGEVSRAAIHRALEAATEPLARARLLPAYIEIMLAASELGAAQTASRELDALAKTYETDVVRAAAAQARGAVHLAGGNPRAALRSLRLAWQLWEETAVPYMAARVRLLMGLACRALGDDDGFRLEVEAARQAFTQLGAVPDLARLESLTASPRPSLPASHTLTPREQQILRLVATGQTNKGIATQLTLSVKTVDRHVANILTKLDVPSRAAATAYAYEQKLL